MAPRRFAGPPTIQSSDRRTPQTGNSVMTGMRSMEGAARNHASVPAVGLVAPSSASAAISSASRNRTIFSGQAGCIIMGSASSTNRGTV